MRFLVLVSIYLNAEYYPCAKLLGFEREAASINEPICKLIQERPSPSATCLCWHTERLRRHTGQMSAKSTAKFPIGNFEEG